MADFVANCIRRKYQWKNDDFYSRLNIVKSIKFPRINFRDKLPQTQIYLTEISDNTIIKLDINPIGSSKE